MENKAGISREIRSLIIVTSLLHMENAIRMTSFSWNCDAWRNMIADAMQHVLRLRFEDEDQKMTSILFN